jgi:RNA polymerase sigma-70 factor (ECF subfamily)
LKILNLTNEIIEACKQNDRQAQETLYRFFFPRLLPVIKSFTNDEDEIISIFNDGMLKVFTKLNTFEGRGDFEAWVFRIIKNSLYNNYRLNYQRLEIFELTDHDNAQSPGILKKMYYDDLVKLLKVLPEQSSRVFKMFVIDGYSHKEISEKLGISIGTSKWHVFKAKEKLVSVIDLNIMGYG